MRKTLLTFILIRSLYINIITSILILHIHAHALRDNIAHNVSVDVRQPVALEPAH
jgi:hypothetical protein